MRYAFFHLFHLLLSFQIIFSQCDPQTAEEEERGADGDGGEVEWPCSNDEAGMLIVS